MNISPEKAAQLAALVKKHDENLASAKALGLERSFADYVYSTLKGFGALKDEKAPASGTASPQ